MTYGLRASGVKKFRSRVGARLVAVHYQGLLAVDGNQKSGEKTI